MCQAIRLLFFITFIYTDKVLVLKSTSFYNLPVLDIVVTLWVVYKIYKKKK